MRAGRSGERVGGEALVLQGGREVQVYAEMVRVVADKPSASRKEVQECRSMSWSAAGKTICTVKVVIVTENVILSYE